MWHVLRLGTISPITKCRKHFWIKVVFSKSTKVITLQKVALYFALRPMVSNCETNNILKYWTSCLNSISFIYKK